MPGTIERVDPSFFPIDKPKVLPSNLVRAALTAEQCRLYAAQSKALGLTDVLGERGIQQTIMSRRWSSIADRIDRDNLNAFMTAFSLKRTSEDR